MADKKLVQIFKNDWSSSKINYPTNSAFQAASNGNELLGHQSGVHKNSKIYIFLQEKEVAIPMTAFRNCDTGNLLVPQEAVRRTRVLLVIPVCRRARAVKRSIVETERRSPRTNCTSWRERSKKVIIRMFTAERNWQ